MTANRTNTDECANSLAGCAGIVRWSPHSERIHCIKGESCGGKAIFINEVYVNLVVS